jgi:hypothetical protein
VDSHGLNISIKFRAQSVTYIGTNILTGFSRNPAPTSSKLMKFSRKIRGWLKKSLSD